MNTFTPRLVLSSFIYFWGDFIPRHCCVRRRRGPVGGFSHPLLWEACSIVQRLMMIVMMACPSLIRNSTPLIKGPGAPVLMAAGPSPRSRTAGEGKARRHPRHTPVDRATKQKRVTLTPPPPGPLSSSWVPQTRPILLPPPHPPSSPHNHKNHNTHTHTLPARPPSLSFTVISFTNQLISLFLTHPPGVAPPTSFIPPHQLLRKVEIHHCVQ